MTSTIPIIETSRLRLRAHRLDDLPAYQAGRNSGSAQALRGRTAALATDLAPHWVGGLVDWGDGERVVAQAPGSWPIEVGNFYAQFIANLLTWTGQLNVAPLESQ